MKQILTIGEMAKLFDVSTDTLRYYEQEGLLQSQRNSENGYRYYSYEDLFVFMDILLFRSLGIAVKEIRPLDLKGLRAAEKCRPGTGFPQRKCCRFRQSGDCPSRVV